MPKIKPQRFFGLHMCEGVAEYQEPGKNPYRIFIGEETLKNMDPTFTGCPVYVRHVEEVDLDNLQEEADGYVIRSFFNSVDGKHWVEFIVVSDRGHEAIRNGWKLSNAYLPKQLANGGLWHGVEYSKEIKNGEYEHLAIVPNPRYEESIVFTPEEFKAYNGEKEVELKRLANEKEKEPTMLNLFKKTKVENAKDFEGMSVTLPKSKKEMLLTDVVAELDKVINMAGYAADDHMVKVGNGEMTVKELVEKHQALCQELEEMKKPKEEEKKEDADDAGSMDEPESAEEAKKEKQDESLDAKLEEKKKEAPASEEKKENEEPKDEKKPEDEKKKNAKAKADALKNAHLTAPVFKDEAKVEFSEDQVARGRARYGSGN